MDALGHTFTSYEITLVIFVITVSCWLLLKAHKKPVSPGLSTKNVRPLGALEVFFEEAHKGGGPFICCTVVRLESSTSLAIDLVRKTLVNLAKIHPFLRAKIESIGPNQTKCFVVSDETVVPLQLLSTTSSSEVFPIMEQEMHKDFGNNNLLWRVFCFKESYNVKRDIYENAIVFATHHAITDGISAITLAGQFAAKLNKLAHGQSIDSIESYDLPDEVLTLLDDEIAWAWWQKALLLPQAMALLFSAFQLFVKIRPMKNIFVDTFPEKKASKDSGSSIVYEEMSEHETKTLIAACKANNCTVQGAVSAAWHLATRKMILESKIQKSDPVFQWYCPVSVRKFCKPLIPSHYLGCYVSSVIDSCKITQIHNIEEYWKLAQRCSQVIRDQISRKQHLRLLRVYDFLDLVKFVPEFKLLTRDAAVHGLTNMGCFDWSKDDDVFKTVQCFLATGNHHYGMVFHNHFSTINGKFNVATTYCKSVVNELRAKQLQEQAFQMLKNNGIL